jgi:hypothetical protein
METSAEPPESIVGNASILKDHNFLSEETKSPARSRPTTPKIKVNLNFLNEQERRAAKISNKECTWAGVKTARPVTPKIKKTRTRNVSETTEEGSLKRALPDFSRQDQVHDSKKKAQEFEDLDNDCMIEVRCLVVLKVFLRSRRKTTTSWIRSLGSILCRNLVSLCD